MAKHELKAVEKTQPAKTARTLSPFEEMDRFIEQAFGGDWMRPFEWRRPGWARLQAPFEGKAPRVDIIDRDNEIVIRAEVPGVNKKDLEVTMGDNTVTIKGSTRREEKEEKGDFYRAEISAGSFSRTLALPANVDSNRARSHYTDGMLEITVPKVEGSKRRVIQVD